MDKVAVLIPCYNESKTVKKVVDGIENDIYSAIYHDTLLFCSCILAGFKGADAIYSTNFFPSYPVEYLLGCYDGLGEFLFVFVLACTFDYLCCAE